MNAAIDRVGVARTIRDQYADIRVLAMHCLSDISPEAIPEMLQQRNELIELIALEEEALAAHAALFSEEPEVASVRSEIASIVETIITLDKQVEAVIKNNLRRIRTELSSLYKTSRAASAYTLQQLG